MADQLKQKMISDGVPSSILEDKHYHRCCFCWGLFEETNKPNLLTTGDLCCLLCFSKLQKFSMKQQGYDTVLQLIKIEKEEVQKIKTFNFYIKGYSKGKARDLQDIPPNVTIGQMLKKSSTFQNIYGINKEKTGVVINHIDFSYEKIKNTTIAYLVKHKSIAEGLQEGERIGIQFHNRFNGGM